MNGAYYYLWDILVPFLYGTQELTGDQNLVMTFVCTFVALFVLSLPVVAIYWFWRKVFK